MEGLLEIDSLSEQDRDIILQVLKRDDEVRKTQELKANQLKVEIQSLRMQSVLRPGDNLSKICARCHGELGVIFNRGDICPKCRFRVCNCCKETMFKGSWLCNLCFKQRQLKLLTGEWAAGPSSGLKQWASGTDLVKASIIYKDHPQLARKQDVISVKSRDQVLQRKQGVVSSSNNSGPRAIGGHEIQKSPAKAANKIEVQKEHTNGVVSAQETERVEYPKDTDKQRLSQLLNFIRAKKPSPAEAQENSREMNVRRITSRNDSESSESSSSSSETDDDIGSSYQPSLRSSSVSPPISEMDYEVQMSESARLQSVHEENIDIGGDGRNQVVKPATLEQLTLESSAVNVTSREISPKEKSKSISDHQKSDTKPDVSTEERHVKSSPSSLSDKSNTNAKMSITASCEVHTSTQSDQSQLQLTSIPGDGKIQSGITSADLPLGRSSSPISVSMDSLSSSHPSPSMSHSNTADLLDKGSMHDTSDTELILRASQQEMIEFMGTESVVREGSVHDTSDTEPISRASQQEMTEFMGTESVVREGSVDDDYVLEEISKVKFRRISQPSKHSEGQGPRFSHSPHRPTRPEGFTAEVEGPRSHSGLQSVSEQFEEGRKGIECRNPFTELRSETAGKVSYDLSIKAVDVDPKFAQDSEIKISQLSHVPNMTSAAVGTDMSPIMGQSTYSNAHPNQFAGSSLSNTASHSVHGSCVDVVNNLACDTLSGIQSSIHSHVIKHTDVSSKDNNEITKQKGSKGMTLLDTTIPIRNRYVSERSVSEADSIGSFNLSPISPIPQSSLEANTGVYTITYFDSDDALEDPVVEEPENDDCVIQWTEQLKSTQIDERPQSLKLDKDQNRGEVPREMDYIGIKEEVIPGYSSLWYVQGVDASKEEFDRLFNQEDKIMKSSKGGYLTRSSSEDSDVLSIIDEQDEEAEKSMENVEKREEHFLYDAYSASECGMTDALKPNNKSAFVCKKQPSHFLDIPEIRDSSSVVFAEHSVKINQEVSNEESFISLDPSNIPDISLDDILAVNRNMSAVGDSDDGDLEEILAYCMGSRQESPQQQKQLPKSKKSSTSDTDIASLDISQMKKAIKEEAAKKEQVYLSEVFQHPHELTVFAGKEFSTRCFVEPSILNEDACTSEDAAKSVSHKIDTPQHTTEVSAKSVSAKMDTPQHPTEVSAKLVSAKMDTPQHPTEVTAKSVSAKMDTPQHPTEVSAKSVSAKMDTPQHPTEVTAKSVSAKMDTPQHPTEVSAKSVSAKMDTPQHPTEVSAKSVSAKMDTPQHPTEVTAKSVSAKMDTPQHPTKVSAKSVSAKMHTPQHPTEVSAKSVSDKMDTPQHPTEVSAKSVSAKMDTPQHPTEVTAKSVSDKMDTPQHPTEVTDFKEERGVHNIKDDSRAVSDEKSLSQVRGEHPDEVVRECKEEKQTHDITAVHLYSECDNKSNLISDLRIEGHQFSEHLSKNCHRSPTDQSSEKLEHQISVDQSTIERLKSQISIDQDTSRRRDNQISIDQDTRVAPHEEDVIEREEQVVRAKTISTNDLEVPMNKLPQKRTVIEESTVVRDPEECDRTEKSSKNTAEWSSGYLSLESHVNDSVIISEQMFLPEEPFCIDYVIQPPEEFSDVDHMAPSTACHHVASQQDADDLSQHQAPQQDADDLSQHQPLQQDADYLSQHVPEDAVDAEIGLILKDPQTFEKVETQKKGENWDDMYVNKAKVVLTLSSGLDSCSEEFVGKIGKKENIVNKTDSAFHPYQNSADPQGGKDGLFSFQESSKACFMIPMIDADIVETEKRTSPVERSESSTSQEDSGHVSLPTSVDHTPEHKRTDSGYSQSSIPSTRSTATDRSEEEDIDTLVASAKSNVGSRGNLLSVIADSRESIVSYYSDAGDISHSNIPVTGEVLFGLNYNYKTGMLEIAVKQCKAIAPADTKRKRSDPYVKTYLLPDKTRSGKRKTKVKKHTLSPIFDEVLKYSVSKSELENRTLWLSVWHNDRFGRNDFLGEVTINFDYYKFDDPTPKWYPLQERMDSQQPSMLTYKGDLILSICFVTTADNKKGQQNVDRGQLHVMIKEAHNLTAVKSNGYSDPFCKGYLLPERHRNSKQKTPVVKKNCNPVWNYKMVFEDMSRAELAERCLELTIWDHEKLASNDFLGGVRLNLGTGLYQGKVVDWMDSKGEEISLWQAILDRPNLWIDSTLILRPNMQKRKF